MDDEKGYRSLLYALVFFGITLMLYLHWRDIRHLQKRVEQYRKNQIAEAAIAEMRCYALIGPIDNPEERKKEEQRRHDLFLHTYDLVKKHDALKQKIETQEKRPDDLRKTDDDPQTPEH